MAGELRDAGGKGTRRRAWRNLLHYFRYGQLSFQSVSCILVIFFYNGYHINFLLSINMNLDTYFPHIPVFLSCRSGPSCVNLSGSNVALHSPKKLRYLMRMSVKCKEPFLRIAVGKLEGMCSSTLLRETG